MSDRFPNRSKTNPIPAHVDVVADTPHPTRSPYSPDPRTSLVDILDRISAVAQADWQPMTRGYEEFYGLLAEARAAIEAEARRSPDSLRTPDLDVAWREIEDALRGRPYPGADHDGMWSLWLYGYPPEEVTRPYGATDNERYHAMATPSLDSHHGNSIIGKGPTPIEALHALRAALHPASPPQEGEK
jgi:hypothetical protein